MAYALFGDALWITTDRAWQSLVSGVFALLVCASAAGWTLSLRARSLTTRKTVDNLNARIRAWWVMAAILIVAISAGRTGSVVLFGVVSGLALREFLALSPLSQVDRRGILAAFIAITPLQYALVWSGWYGLFAMAIPVYASLILSIRAALTGDAGRFLQRTATAQWGLLICVYFVSHGPALLLLTIPGYAHQNAKLLFFLVLVVQLSDVFQYVWGKTLGRTPVAPHISPHKTWEGLLGGVLTATAIGAALWRFTPFSPWEAATMAFVITLMGFAGGLVMSAIKRDRGVKDFGTMIAGHGGILDRIDSLCFAAPVFFHLTRYFHAR